MTCRRPATSYGTAFARGAKDTIRPADIEAFAAFVRSPRYADLLLGNRAYAAWIGSEMVGIAAWSVGEAPSPTARILAVFVHPLFTGDGIGTRLDRVPRGRGRAAGYRALEVSATLNAVGFFEHLGYLERARRRLGAALGPRDADRLHAQGERRPAATQCTDGRPSGRCGRAAAPRVRSRPISGSSTLSSGPSSSPVSARRSGWNSARPLRPLAALSAAIQTSQVVSSHGSSRQQRGGLSVSSRPRSAGSSRR